MEKNDLFNLFHLLSKIIIVLPIIVVIIALILKFNQKSNSVPLTIITPTVQQNKIKVQPSPKIKINLKGPLVCGGGVKEASASAFIKDKKIKIVFDQKNETDNILITGDCYYRWKTGKYSGERICGISSVMSIAETMINFGGIGFEAKITDLIKSCKKENIDEKIFEVPANILFKNNK